MTVAPAPVRRIRGIDAAAIPFDDLIAAQQPAVLEGVAANWPLVTAGRASPQEAAAYLAQFAGDHAVTLFTASPESGGRFHYDETATRLNFTASRADLRTTLAAMTDPDNKSVLYIGSTDLDQFLPGLRDENDLLLIHPDFGHKPPLASIWIGNRTITPAHYDISNNLACCMVGARRFTLFPPDQVANLYPGPLDPTPAGQVVSMVDFRNPDFARYPRFRDALARAQVADLLPGDVLFYPALWWHQVEALDGFNAMINYWWNPVPAFIDTPETTMLHAILSLRDRPETEKRAWASLFDYYVFGAPDLAAEHLPKEAQGALAPLDEMGARRLRAKLLNRLNR